MLMAISAERKRKESEAGAERGSAGVHIYIVERQRGERGKRGSS